MKKLYTTTGDYGRDVELHSCDILSETENQYRLTGENGIFDWKRILNKSDLGRVSETAKGALLWRENWATKSRDRANIQAATANLQLGQVARLLEELT